MQGHIVPGFDSKFGSQLFFVTRGSPPALQAQYLYKVERTELHNIEDDKNPCESKNEMPPRYFIDCAESITKRMLKCTLPWEKEDKHGKTCDTPAEYDVRNWRRLSELQILG